MSLHPIEQLLTPQPLAQKYAQKADGFFSEGDIPKAITYYRLALMDKTASHSGLTPEVLNTKLRELSEHRPESMDRQDFQRFYNEFFVCPEEGRQITQEEQITRQEQILEAAREAYYLKNYSLAVRLFDQYNWELPGYDEAHKFTWRGRYYKSMVHEKDYGKLYKTAENFHLQSGHPIDLRYWAEACLGLYNDSIDKNNTEYLEEAIRYFTSAIKAIKRMGELPSEVKIFLQKLMCRCHEKLAESYNSLADVTSTADVALEYTKLAKEQLQQADQLNAILYKNKPVKAPAVIESKRQQKTVPPQKGTQGIAAATQPKQSFPPKKPSFFPIFQNTAEVSKKEAAVFAVAGSSAVVGLPLFVLYLLERDKETLNFFTKELVPQLPVYAFLIMAFMLTAISIFAGVLKNNEAELEGPPQYAR